jgi:hypothetical protein
LITFAKETIKSENPYEFKFSSLGDSHSMPRLTNVYYKDPEKYVPDISVNFEDKIIPVRCDNGIINDQYHQIKQTFPNAKILRLTIGHWVRPVIYQTCIIKGVRTNLLEENNQTLLDNWTDCHENYAIRENFTLLYHNWPFKWEFMNDENIINFDLENFIIDHNQAIMEIFNLLELTIIEHSLLEQTLTDWRAVNEKYFKIYFNAKNILHALSTDQQMDIAEITDLHEQGFINYCIEKYFNVTIPVYDYRNWFSNTKEIKSMAEDLCSKSNT